MKMMIVDDNKQLREGIHYGIPWDEYGFTDVREYADGEEAAEDMKIFQPDIILADIRMPNMDGLELLEYVRKLKKECKYILLSAYSDFEYAQKAIQFGVDDYILKPVKPGKLIEIIMVNVRKLLKEQEDMNAYYDVYEKSFLHLLTSGSPIGDVEKLKDFLRAKYEYILPVNYAYLVLMRIELPEDHMTRKINAFPEIKSLREKLKDEGILFDIQEGRLLFLGRGSNSQLIDLNSQNKVKLILERANQILEEKGFVLTASISGTKGLSKLEEAFEHAEKGMEFAWYEKPGACLIYHLLLQKEQPDLDNKLQIDYREQITKAVQEYAVEDLEETFGSFQELGLRNKYKRQQVQEFLKKLYLHLIRVTKMESDLNFQTRVIDQAPHFELCIQEFIRHLKHFMESRGKALEEEHYSAIVKNTCIYINEHYSEPITVEGVAGHFGRTPNYLSAKFKREVGKSFTDYLMDIRIERAVHMIQYTDIPINEIAGKTGFGSYAYFSRIFKKKTGKPAGSYRSGGE